MNPKIELPNPTAVSSYPFNKKFSLVTDNATIARLFTPADEDLMEYSRDMSYGYRATIHQAYQVRNEVISSSWNDLYCKIQGFQVKLKGKKKADFITVGIKPNAKCGTLSQMSKDSSEVYEELKPGNLTIEQIYIDLREAFTIIRTKKTWICLYQTPAKENYACVINRDVVKDATIVDLLLFTRSQTGIKNYGFSE